MPGPPNRSRPYHLPSPDPKKPNRDPQRPPEETDEKNIGSIEIARPMADPPPNVNPPRDERAEIQKNTHTHTPARLLCFGNGESRLVIFHFLLFVKEEVWHPPALLSMLAMLRWRLCFLEVALGHRSVLGLRVVVVIMLAWMSGRQRARVPCYVWRCATS